MTYLTHPYFDESGNDEWVELLLNTDDTPLLHERIDELGSVVACDFVVITKLVLDRLTACMPADWLEECPNPILNQVQYHPLEEHSMRVFLEYCFRPNRTENSHHTDSWWAIVLCPYLDGPPYENIPKYVVEHFGWSID